MKWRGELVGLQNCYLGLFSHKLTKIPARNCVYKFSDMFPIFDPFSKFSPSKSKWGQKNETICSEGNGWWIPCVQNFKLISSKIAEIWHKTCQKQALFTSFRDFTGIFRILFFETDFDASKSVLGSCFLRDCLRKSGPRKHVSSSI